MDRRKRQRAARLRARRQARLPSVMPFGLSDDTIVGLARMIDTFSDLFRHGYTFTQAIERATDGR